MAPITKKKHIDESILKRLVTLGPKVQGRRTRKEVTVDCRECLSN